jgi:hypothetical protein
VPFSKTDTKCTLLGIRKALFVFAHTGGREELLCAPGTLQEYEVSALQGSLSGTLMAKSAGHGY